MEGDTVAHALGANRALPFAQQIAMRAERDGVPRLVAGVPVVVLVMVHALNQKEPGAGVVIGLGQRRRIQGGGIPGVKYVFVAGHRRMPEVTNVIGVGGGAPGGVFYVHLSRVPVAALPGRLRTEVHPDAELGLA